jgi:hypothetical protein
MENAEFFAAFKAAKQQIGSMKIRYVAQTHSVRQALLEIYIAVALKTKHNDFDNH